MKRFWFIFLVILLALSCSTQRQLKKSFTGRPVTALEGKFGQPHSVIEKKDGTIYIFEKSETLKSTKISQGKLTLDPIISPKVTKTERYYFTVKNGIITKTRFEEEYER